MTFRFKSATISSLSTLNSGVASLCLDSDLRFVHAPTIVFVADRHTCLHMRLMRCVGNACLVSARDSFCNILFVVALLLFKLSKCKACVAFKARAPSALCVLN